MKLRIEIVHVNYIQALHYQTIRQANIAIKAEAILKAYDHQRAVYIDDLCQSLPEELINQQIIIGGGLRNLCVNFRYEYLKLQGYINVKIDDRITIQNEDFKSWLT